jgi:AraC-type DNA-binding domain-containing proteins
MINRIEQLCKFAFNFSNMDTIFIDKESNIKLDYGFAKMPASLSPYFSGIINKLQINDRDHKYIVSFHYNSYKLNYISGKIYDNYGDYLGSIILGPFLLEEPTILMINSVISHNKMSITLRKIINQYYLTLPILSTYKANTSAEFLAYIVSSFKANFFNREIIGNLNYEFETETYVSTDLLKNITDQTIEDLEKIYNIENTMLHAVELGDKEFLQTLINENISLLNVPYAIPTDPLRSIKNLGIVLNTLLRKAAEKGGLHPIYLDSISSKYIVQTEKCSSIGQIKSILNSMKIEYCDSVRKLSLKRFSTPIRKTIEFIRLNLNQPIDLNYISSELHLNPSELSRQFKKEIGENLTEYINKRRINESLFLLENDSLSITDISLMVGYNDVNYFTKVFKKIKNMTPSQYRKINNF